MIKIAYSQKNVRVNNSLERVEIIPRKKIIPIKELKWVKIMFGGDECWKEDGSFFPGKFQNEVKGACTNQWVKDCTHFVLGEKNKTLLLRFGVPENNIVLVDKKARITFEGQSHVYYEKTFLMNYAAEALSNYNVLFTDYDCFLVRTLDKKDIYSRLKGDNNIFQSSFCHYKRRPFTNIDGGRQGYGLQTCLVYWGNKEIIKNWLEVHKKNLWMCHDEPPLLLALEQMFGRLSVSDLVMRFDTKIIQTRRKGGYENPYFRHR